MREICWSKIKNPYLPKAHFIGDCSIISAVMNYARISFTKIISASRSFTDTDDSLGFRSVEVSFDRWRTKECNVFFFQQPVVAINPWYLLLPIQAFPSNWKLVYSINCNCRPATQKGRHFKRSTHGLLRAHRKKIRPFNLIRTPALWDLCRQLGTCTNQSLKQMLYHNFLLELSEVG